eukprot:scaffold109409_cov19-Tisochrysis_lutea.AAC.3
MRVSCSTPTCSSAAHTHGETLHDWMKSAATARRTAADDERRSGSIRLTPPARKRADWPHHELRRRPAKRCTRLRLVARQLIELRLVQLEYRRVG